MNRIVNSRLELACGAHGIEKALLVAASEALALDCVVNDLWACFRTLVDQLISSYKYNGFERGPWWFSEESLRGAAYSVPVPKGA